MLGQQRRTLAPRGEEEALDGDESGDVADVAVELRDEDRVLVVELDGQPPHAGGVAPGERAQVAQRLQGPGGQVASPPRSSGEGGLVDRRRRVRASTRMRLTIRPPNGMPASRSRRRKKIASSTGAGSGEAMIRKVVAGSPSSRLDRARALGESVDDAAQHAEERAEVGEQVDAR